MTIVVEKLLDLYSQIHLIRRIEEKIAEEYHQQTMRCPVHLSIGQEAVAVGVSAHLNSNDRVYSNHRAHAHYLALNANLESLIAELHGLENGCCGGRGGSMHLIDLEKGFAGSTPIVGATVPIAMGAAFAFKQQKRSHIAVSYLGDGCFEEGVVYESLNFAALHRLPILFVLENNQYSVYTRLKQRQPEGRSISKLAAAMGVSVLHGDGNCIDDVYGLAAQAIAQIRAGKGPYFIELDTYRWPEHCGPSDDDHLGYRPQGELAAWKARCPLQYAKTLLVQAGVALNHIQQLEQKNSKKIESAWLKALNGLTPNPQKAAEGVYV